MPLGHLGLNVTSLPRAKAFYDAVMSMVEGFMLEFVCHRDES